jgi:serine protease Do
MNVNKKYTMIIAVFMAVALVGLGSQLVTASKDSTPPMVPANFSELAETARPGVVNIRTVKTIQGGGRVFRHFFGTPFGEKDPFRDFFGPFSKRNSSSDLEQRSLGSGFIMDREGYIVTNNHVIENADQIKVKLANGKEFDAKIIGRDPKTDLALIKIEGSSDLHPLKMGDSKALSVGSWVLAIGSPFGLEQTVTAGIVSAKGRTIGAGPYDDFIQTDASINPGNSGGPLLNMKGEVVGINTAIMATGQGIGFAIPVSMAKAIIPQLKEKGQVTRGWLGVGIQPVTQELAEAFGLKEQKGALVSQVFEDGPAEKAGIQAGDIILEFDRQTIDDSRGLPRMVASTPVGKAVTIKLFRNGETITREVTLGEMKEATKVAKAPLRKPLGVTVQTITPEIVQALGLNNETGVVVTGVEPGSPAARAGILRGDVIAEINRKPIRDAEEFSQAIDQAKDQGTILFLIQRGESNLFVAVMPK